ncbi:24116_t:CDS:2 [Cetraspora pellucida]|uniref:24116_t:CDS:1 n=1 Tax=Cetraspora pellucida TaxID=1433469 RepID=A0A9N9JQP4_9GLOM|nr:24116_t:CDS:2 [Cetraspora pellucida]
MGIEQVSHIDLVETAYQQIDMKDQFLLLKIEPTTPSKGSGRKPFPSSFV